MFLSTNKCEGIGECIKACPTESIRLINGKAFSCITCGTCFEACPNQTIFKNRYGGYVVDKSKCNGCGFCEFTCPVDSIHIKNGITKGICARCGICVDACPSKSRVDSFHMKKEKQLNFLKSLNLSIPTLEKHDTLKSKVKRNFVEIDYDLCILCGRCAYYCPIKAIDINMNQKGVCTECRVCVDVCPADAIDEYIIDHDECVLCLDCLKSCPNMAIELNNFEVNISKSEYPISGSIISCLNCGLCVDNSTTGALKNFDGKIRYDPSIDFEKIMNKIDGNVFDRENDNINLTKELVKIDAEIKKLNQKSIESCPISTLSEDLEDELGLTGYCVSCSKCVKVCDRQNARNFVTFEWDGSVSDDCISCGICSELCPKNAITLKRSTIEVDTDKCILCETCGIHCPVDAIPKTTLAKKHVTNGFNLIDSKSCMNCKLCHKICPEGAIINKEDFSLSVDNNKCIYCGACHNVCPAKAFIFEREFEYVNESINK